MEEYSLHYTDLAYTKAGITLALDIAKHLGFSIAGVGFTNTDSTIFKADSLIEQKFMLKAWLENIIDEYKVTRIVVEGVYGGDNYTTLHRLITLGTAPQDVAYERGLDIITYDNNEWKATIRSLTTQYQKGYNDKVTIAEILKQFGFVSDSEDATDSLGILIHDNMMQKGIKKSIKTKTIKKISDRDFTVLKINTNMGILGLVRDHTDYTTHEYKKGATLLSQINNQIQLNDGVFSCMLYTLTDIKHLGIDTFKYRMTTGMDGLLVIPKKLTKANKDLAKLVDYYDVL